MEFKEYAESFKSMLVKRYNWLVNEADSFDTSILTLYFEQGISKEDAYFTIFNVEQDLFEGHIVQKPV